MSGLQKMTLTAYNNNLFSGTPVGKMNLLVNPASYQLTKNVGHSKNKELGNQGSSVHFNKYENEDLSFSVTIDGTGIIPGTHIYTVADEVEKLEKLVYNSNSKIHQPNYVIISWGNLIFEGQLSKYSLNYSLFSPAGTPIRVKIDLTFSHSISADYTQKKDENGEVISEKIELKEGDSVSSVCYEKYKNPLKAPEVAKANDLASFRNVPAGQKITYPQ